MSDSIRKAILSTAVATFCLAAASGAGAAGLGELKVASSLGQPLKAEIEVVSSRGEKDLEARLSPSFYQGEATDPALTGLQVKLVRRGERSVLQLKTLQPVNSPFVELPVELRSNVANVTRRYTVLLDPPLARTAEPITPVALR